MIYLTGNEAPNVYGISCFGRMSLNLAIIYYFPFSQLRAEGVYSSIMKSREVYRPIALQAGVMFKASSVMRHIKPLYQTSLQQFLTIFDNAIKQSDR